MEEVKSTTLAQLEYAAEVFADLPFGYLLILPNQKIHQVNQTLLNWLGYEAEDLIRKKKFSDLLTIGGKIYYETHHLPLEKLQGYANEQNYTLLGRDKLRLPVLVNTTQEKDQKEQLLFTQIFIINISDRKKYELDLLRAKKTADAAIEAKTKFISTISHEIRTPLQALIGISDILLHNDPRQDQLQLLQSMAFASKNLLELINHILDFSKSDSEQVELNLKPFHFRELIQQTVASLQFIAQEKELAFTINIDERIPEYLSGDVPKISQVLNNILGNAIKFTPAGYIKTNIQLLDQVKDHLLIHFSIEDSGIGIPAQKIEKIFESFSQGHDSGEYSGAGLGLAISQNLIRLHQSELKVNSEEGKGSIFSFTLPFQLVVPTKKQRRGSQSLLELLPDIKVLLVEDNPSNVFIISRYFKNWQLDFDLAKNGKVALEMIRQTSYDLILMDLQMPVMDGFATIKAIRAMRGEEFQHLPVVAISASATDDVKNKLLEAGFHNCILKPFDPEELHGLVQAVSLRKSIKIEPNPQDEIPAQATSYSFEQLDYTGLYELMEGDDQALRQFINIVLKDWEQIYQEIEKGIVTKNTALFLQARHKTISTIKLFNATRLKDLLDQAKEVMESPHSYGSDNTVFESLLAVFQHTLDQLRTYLAEGPPEKQGQE